MFLATGGSCSPAKKQAKSLNSLTITWSLWTQHQSGLTPKKRYDDFDQEEKMKFKRAILAARTRASNREYNERKRKREAELSVQLSAALKKVSDLEGQVQDLKSGDPVQLAVEELEIKNQNLDAQVRKS